MSSKLTGLLMSYLVLLIGLAPVSALATIEWTFSPSCSGPPCATDPVGFQTFLATDSTGSATGPSVATSGWSNTADGGGSASVANSKVSPRPAPVPNSTLQSGRIVQGSNGLGVINADAYSPVRGTNGTDWFGEQEYWGSNANTMDNSQRIDLILLEFCVTPSGGAAPDAADCIPEEVALSEISLWQSAQEIGLTDLDISVLAYTGTGTPDLSTGLQYTATAEDLTANGWELIGNYDVGSTPHAINSDGVSSSHWIVSPFNPALCETGNCGPDSLDYLQVTGLKGNSTVPTVAANTVVAAAVPVPGTLFLLAGGLPLIRRMRSIRAKVVHR